MRGLSGEFDALRPGAWHFDDITTSTDQREYATEPGNHAAEDIGDTWLENLMGSRSMRAQSLLALLALTACRDAVIPVPPPPRSTLTVTVRLTSSFHWEWPRGSGNSVVVNSALDDEAGLAGIEVEITDVADGGLVRTHSFDASDLAEGVTPYEVPESGTAQALVRLTQDGKVVAIGIAEWPLRPEIEWEVEIQRAPRPMSVGSISPAGDLSKAEYGCGWRWCDHIWRFDISEDVLNYPGETLWLVLWAVYECPPDVVCF